MFFSGGGATTDAFLRSAEAEHRTRFVAWDKITHRRDVCSPSQRVAVVTANGRNLPALICSIVSDVLPNKTCMGCGTDN
jgi:hypothetical protein